MLKVSARRMDRPTELDCRAPKLPLTRVGRSGAAAGPARLAVIALALLMIAILKPWSSPANLPSAPRQPPPPVPSLPALAARTSLPAADAGPTTVLRPDGPDDLRCLWPGGWRLVTIERGAAREVRTWIVVAPLAASGPLDPRFDPVRITSTTLLGVGLCAPARGPGAAPWMATAPRIVALWRLPGEGAGPLVPLPPTLPPVPLAGATTGDPYDGPANSALGGRLAVLYRSPLGPGAWPPGRYVFMVGQAAGAPGGDWFTLEVDAPGSPSQ